MDTKLLNIKWNNDGLIPAVVQNAKTGDILMLGYMNEASLTQTQSTGLVTFYSRSRSKLWTKGESSGNYLRALGLKLDCDRDALLVQASPDGPTCHTGENSCFFNPVPLKATPDISPQDDVCLQADDALQIKTMESKTEKKCMPACEHTLDKLMTTVQDRKNNPVDGSYTNYLFEEGLGKILKKIGEESSEIIIAALSEKDEDLIGEIGDLIYHLTVLMADKNINWQEILELLDSRAS